MEFSKLAILLFYGKNFTKLRFTFGSFVSCRKKQLEVVKLDLISSKFNIPLVINELFFIDVFQKVFKIKLYVVVKMQAIKQNCIL